MSATPNEKMLPTHHELHVLRSRIQEIHTAIVNFEPLTAKPPILDSSVDSGVDSSEDCQWLQPESVPGLRTLREAVKKDLDVLEKVLSSCFVAIGPVVYPDFSISSSSLLILAVTRCQHCLQMPLILSLFGMRYYLLLFLWYQSSKCFDAVIRIPQHK
jgi:hypothetical protein